MKKANNNSVIKPILILFIITVSLFFGFISNSTFAEKLELCCNDNKNVIEGLYLLNSCENGRFKIKIEKKGDVYFYNVLDKKIVIAKGNVIILKEDDIVYLTFGKIEGVLDKKSIKIQNYGNSMNEYIHFTQCEEKYLSFEKKLPPQ